MPIFRVEKSKDYTIVNNAHIRDKRLSLKAKGLFELMLALPDEWDYSVKGLLGLCNERQSALDSALKELKEYGYLVVEKRFPSETESGRIEYTYTVYERPQDPKKQGVENQGVENQGVDFQGVENPHQLNTNKSNTKESNTEESRTNGYGRMPKPTLEEVKAYCAERKNSVDPQRFIDYYSANGWRVGKNPMKDWKAAVRTWERNEQKDTSKHFDNERKYGDDFFAKLEGRSK
jgi:hypothetical protein